VIEKVQELKSKDLRVYSTVQLATEIEVLKKQERSLIAQVEQQQYVETVMKEEQGRLDKQLLERQELCKDTIMKM